MREDRKTLFDGLSAAEKLQLVEDLWDNLAVVPDNVPVHDWQRDELDRRKGNLLQHPASGLTRDTGRVYCIIVDMDPEALRNHYGDSYNNAYLEIRRVLQPHGFTWQQGSVYFGGETVTAVTCVLAAQELARTLPWFAASVCDIRMLRIEELNDLLAVVRQAGGEP